MFSRMQRTLSVALTVSLAALNCAYPLLAQTAIPDAQTGVPVFQLKARTVVVDVVVTDSSDQPVLGLHKEDFGVRESGAPQAISFFEEHTGVAAETTPPPVRQPDMFSNVPPSKYTDSVNVLLLDSLNTPIRDQSFVHNESLKYLKTVEPGTRLAVFTLTNELRFVQGFTSDLSVLAGALNHKSASSPQLSSLLRSNATQEAEAQQVEMVKEYQASTGGEGYGPAVELAASIQALQDFQAQTQSFELNIRMKQTLLAMQQLARYLAGIPGRKNVIWFTGAFPPPDADHKEQYEDDMKKTGALLAASQVAIYPIAAEGVEADNYNDVEHRLSGISSAQSAISDQSQGLQQDTSDRNGRHTTMQRIADDTGGKAFYNTNGLKEAVARVLHNGSHYYTIAYTPTNDKMDGNYRKIQVDLAGKNGYKLSYRPGYYAADARNEKQVAQKTINDPLHPFMGRGMPDSSQIPYTMRLVPSPKQPDPANASDHAGDNATLKAPFTRYAATFILPADGLRLEPAADGAQHGYIEAALVVYDYQGKAQNWEVRMLDFNIKPERYAAALKFGIPVRLEIDAPPGEMYLRTGVYDPASKAAGTLEIPLSEVIAPVLAAQ